MHAAHTIKICVLESLGLFKIFRLGIHHPNLGIGNVANLAASSVKNAGEDGRLVLQQEGAKGDGEDQPEIFGPITCQHFESDEVHDCPP